jgi:DNA-binding CsgD family transcriptional regulator
MNDDTVDLSCLMGAIELLPGFLGIGLAIFTHPSQPIFIGKGSRQAFDGIDFKGPKWAAAVEDAATGKPTTLISTGRHKKTVVLLICLPNQQGKVVAFACDKTSSGAQTITRIAQQVGLTDSEAQVLHAIYGGLKPCEVARKRSVSMTTVRTQVRAILGKTGTSGIPQLITKVSGFSIGSPFDQQ